ncbi:MAG: hypothetical protein A2173_11255 [Planctomycetes bacterium RBG_13_44_8b]|nr:MAG: hypothetical protein A2173_11255 [Planctomycetes bacterium RBG_13_44_8b]
MNADFHHKNFWVWRIVNQRTKNPQQQADSDEHRIATAQSRQAKVLIVLVISMMTGIIFLKALGNNPPSAGAFCLAQYRHLVPVEEAVSSRAAQFVENWNSIHIYYSSILSNKIQLALLADQAAPEDINCHFIICNGLVGVDGQIQRTEKWERQHPMNHESPNKESQTSKGKHTIYICVITDGQNPRPTGLQIKRTEELVEELCRRFDIRIGPGSIHCPNDWR